MKLGTAQMAAAYSSSLCGAEAGEGEQSTGNCELPNKGPYSSGLCCIKSFKDSSTDIRVLCYADSYIL